MISLAQYLNISIPLFVFMNIELFNEEDSHEVSKLLNEFLEYTRESYSNEVLEFDDYVDSNKNDYVEQILNSFINLKESRFLMKKRKNNLMGQALFFFPASVYNPCLVFVHCKCLPKSFLIYRCLHKILILYLPIPCLLALFYLVRTFQ